MLYETFHKVKILQYYINIIIQGTVQMCGSKFHLSNICSEANHLRSYTDMQTSKRVTILLYRLYLQIKVF